MKHERQRVFGERVRESQGGRERERERRINRIKESEMGRGRERERGGE